MAVLSTLKYIPTEADTATTHLAQSSEAYSSFNSSKSNVVPFKTSNISVAPAAQFTHGQTLSTLNPADDLKSLTSLSAVDDIPGNHQHSGAPMDGEMVWFCSDCNNGPMGTWYGACPMCGHVYCGYCKLEEV
ncbi:hypothetical protein SVAN01_10064 [Stagonosporopsis vannaccii]|nr:hypothetical protein SVAN01_10064 [Stagonosporopsis vannaccii]